MFKNLHLYLFSQYLTWCTLGHVKSCVDFEQEWSVSHLDLLPPPGVIIVIIKVSARNKITLEMEA
jgi:hypothetical protein